MLREHEPASRDELTVRWLGTAGFELKTPTTTLLIDPYLTRAGLFKLMTGPARSDCRAVTRRFDRVDAILMGHSHYDHLLDGPAIARDFGAKLIGSRDTVRIGRAEGLPDSQLQEVQGGDRVEIGDFTIEVVPSVHAKLFTQVWVGGDMPEHFEMPLGFMDYKNGPVFGFLIHWNGRTLYHCGSADLIDDQLAGHRADVLLQCIAGWKSDQTVFARMARALDPRVVVPMHQDDFFRPFKKGMRLSPVAYMDEAIAHIRREMPAATVTGLDFFEAMALGGQDE
jgi:L-ascorbate metabolism protein UlaG (beta-lactamase superfamily)